VSTVLVLGATGVGLLSSDDGLLLLSVGIIPVLVLGLPGGVRSSNIYHHIIGLESLFYQFRRVHF
jgi:hypothetical protein